MITLIFNIDPVSKQRPRVVKGGWTYTPKKTKDFETSVKIMARSQMERAGASPFTGAINVTCLLQFPKPKKPSNPFPKEDIDNCAKAILDALNEIAYLDDKQIVELHIKKEYTQFSGRIQIQISPQEHQPL